MPDYSAVANPRRAMIRRELEAGSQSAAQAPAAALATQQPGSVRFQKPYTEAERAMQAKKLAEMLRARQ